MADLIFTSEELYSLTEKLGSVATTLSEREWEILLTIFANGTDRIQGNPEQNEGTLPEAQLSQDVERITDPRAATAEELKSSLVLQNVLRATKISRASAALPEFQVGSLLF